MNEQQYIKLVGTGSYLPGKPLTINEVDEVLGHITKASQKIQKWLARMKELMKQMIEIERYYFAIDPATGMYIDDNISMSVGAAQKALQQANMQASDIELIVYGSPHQDQMPTTSVRIQEALGIERCAELGIHANCTSAYKALLVAGELLQSGRYQNALVVSSNVSSSEMRASYYNQSIVKKEELFLRYFLSDGAGALVLRVESKIDKGIYLKNTYIESVGGCKPAAMSNKRPAYWMNPKEEYELGYHHLAQLFNEELRANFHESDGSVFYQGLQRMLHKFLIEIDKIRYFQVNFPSKHISEIVMDECEQLGIQRNKLYSKMSSMGYVGPPMAFICLDEIVRNEPLEANDLILSFVTEVSKFMQAGFCFEMK